jgi:hypothetical protein
VRGVSPRSPAHGYDKSAKLTESVWLTLYIGQIYYIILVLYWTVMVRFVYTFRQHEMACAHDVALHKRQSTK